MKISFENINQFLKDYSNKNSDCEHNFPDDFEIIGTLIDNSYGFLSFLDFKTKNDKEVFIGSYPLNSAKLWKCKRCNRLTFSITNDTGFGGLIPLNIDFNKDYLIEPANKSVLLKKKNLLRFIEKFGIGQLKYPESIDESYSGKRIINKDNIEIFGFRNYTKYNVEMIKFEIIANRVILREIFEFEQQQYKRTHNKV